MAAASSAPEPAIVAGPSRDRLRARLTLAATIIASSMTFIDATVVNVALPALQADLRATLTDVQWVIEAYALFLGALILVGGSLGDIFGRKKVYLTGLFGFTLISLLCALAPDSRTLIITRFFQGVFGALLVALTVALWPEGQPLTAVRLART